jgi:hypothetical protein
MTPTPDVSELCAELRKLGGSLGTVANKSAFSPSERGHAAGKIAVAVLEAAAILQDLEARLAAAQGREAMLVGALEYIKALKPVPISEYFVTGPRALLNAAQRRAKDALKATPASILAYNEGLRQEGRAAELREALAVTQKCADNWQKTRGKYHDTSPTSVFANAITAAGDIADAIASLSTQSEEKK